MKAEKESLKLDIPEMTTYSEEERITDQVYILDNRGKLMLNLFRMLNKNFLYERL